MKIEPVSVKMVIDAHKNNTLKEVWGVGTAVVTSVFKALGYKNEIYKLPELKNEDSFAIKLKTELINIQSNVSEDPFGWRVLVEKN